jgi:hypothetical protein
MSIGLPAAVKQAQHMWAKTRESTASSFDPVSRAPASLPGPGRNSDKGGYCRAATAFALSATAARCVDELLVPSTFQQRLDMDTSARGS